MMITAPLVHLGRALQDSGYTFTTVSAGTHARVNGRPGNARAHDLRGVFGWGRPFGPGVLPEEITGRMAEAGVLERDGDEWRSTVRFATHAGDLYAHESFFRPECARLADVTAIHLLGRALPVRRALQYGCGVAAGAVTVAKRAPGADVIAIDDDPSVVRYAEVNATLAGTERVRPARLEALDGTFDLIIANPTGTDQCLEVLGTAAERLDPGGSLVLVTATPITGGHDPFRSAAAGRLAGTGLSWTYREVDPDVHGEQLDTPEYGDADRIAVVALAAVQG